MSTKLLDPRHVQAAIDLFAPAAGPTALRDEIRHVAAELARLAEGFGDGSRTNHHTLARMQERLDALRDRHRRLTETTR